MEIRKEGRMARILSTYDEYGYFYSEEAIPFGAGVMRGTDPADQCKTMLTGGKFIGVAAAKNLNINDKKEYTAQSTVEVIKKGYVWVQVADAVVAGDKAACGLNGKWAKTGTLSYDDVNGVFETSAEAKGYAILHLKG